MSEMQPKKPMTHEERIALAAKLDKELDEFIENLPRRNTDNIEPEEGWLEELENHPFFLKKTPEPGDKVHPLYEGLQQLKYDPNENTPDELAVSYKDDGNFNFKHKNYRLAILGYTEGIKVKCGNVDIESSLYNNRAAANWFLGNYRSCLKDCEQALKIKPNYDKVIIRAANACLKTENYEKSIEYCDMLLEMNKNHIEIINLRKSATNLWKLKERADRKRSIALKKQEMEENQIISELKKRNIRIDEFINLTTLEPHFPELMNHRVHLSDLGVLVWPIVFLYPEYQLLDFVKEFYENVKLENIMEEVFSEIPEWDRKKEYKLDNLNMYYENKKLKKLYKVDISKTLLEILQESNYQLEGATPSFIILVRNSKTELNFIKQYE